MELKIENLTKQYGNKMAIQNVSCTLKPGVVGLLGANGAGKSTLMRMISVAFLQMKESMERIR